MNKKLLLILILTLILLPALSPVLAQEGNCEGPIVPCGNIEGGQPPCQLCHLFILFENIVDFVLLCLVPPVAVLMILLGGIMFIFSYGAIPGVEPQSQQISKARSLLTSVMIGLVILYGSWLIVNAFFSMIGLADNDFGRSVKNWYELDIDCATSSSPEPGPGEEEEEELTASCSVSPSTAETGESVTFSGSASGGSGSYSYQWSGDCNGTSQNCSKTFSSEGTYSATVQVSSNGESNSDSCSVEVEKTCVDNDGDGSCASEDCCDNDDHVYPGAGFSKFESNCGGWDLNCDGTVEKEITKVGNCECNGENFTGTTGWKRGIAPCGQKKSWFDGEDCHRVFFGLLGWDCHITNKVQGCK